MPALARLWFTSPAADSAAQQPQLQRLAERPLAHIAHAPDPASQALAQSLAIATQIPTSPYAQGPPLETLTTLASTHADQEILLIASPDLLTAALIAALGLPPDTQPPTQRPGALHAFNWPTAGTPNPRPELLGLDLDWFPPWTPGQPQSRFPGGPGVAGTSR